MTHQEFMEQTEKFKTKLALSWFFDLSYADINRLKLTALLKEHERFMITDFFTRFLLKNNTQTEDYVRCIQYLFDCDRFKAYEICEVLSQESLDKLYSNFVRKRLSETLSSIRDEERTHKL